MKNAEWIIKTGHTFKQLRLIQHNELANRTYTVMLCDEPVAELNDKKEQLDVFRKWLDMEHKEPILDEAERAYLSAVIRPFRKSVISIEKSTIYGEGEVICIDTEKSDIVLPPFEEGTMYKGMELDREYKLEELGL